MSNERELLKEIMSYFAKGDITIRKFENSSDVAETLHTAQELLSQPEQPEQITFKDDADKITHLENSVELLAGLLEDKKYVPLSDEDALKLFEEAEYLWFLEYKIGELKMQKQEQATTQEV